MVLDRDNQVAFSRFKGSLPFRTDVGGLDHCGKLGLEMIEAKNGEVSAQSQAMPSQMSEGLIVLWWETFSTTGPCFRKRFKDACKTADAALRRLLRIRRQRSEYP